MKREKHMSDKALNVFLSLIGSCAKNICTYVRFSYMSYHITRGGPELQRGGRGVGVGRNFQRSSFAAALESGTMET